VANTWVSSLDTILDAYEEIGEKIPSFLQYQGLFERNLGMRAALDLYYCDILEFHYHALQFLSRPGEFSHVLLNLDGGSANQRKAGESSLVLLGKRSRHNFDTFWTV
jgi:hypothetical protein